MDFTKADDGRNKGEKKMKKLMAVSLVLILIISICAPAFAAYPKAAFTNASKKQWVRYGDKIYWTLKLNSGSYNMIRQSYWGSVKKYYRSKFIITLKRGEATQRVMDYFFTTAGDWTNTYWLKTSHPDLWIVDPPRTSTKYDVYLETYFRDSIYSSNWIRCRSRKTYFYLFKAY